MPNMKVGYDPQTGKVVFGRKLGHRRGYVEMRGPATITFTAFKRKPCTFKDFRLTPNDPAQFHPITVDRDRITVEDRFTDKKKTTYKYTIVVTAPDGSRHVGDPQIVNKPSM